MRFAIIASVLLAASASSAQELKEGWGVQFRQDTFDKTVFPVAMMSENGDGFDKALFAVACGNGGSLVSFFQIGRMSFDNSAKAQFRTADGTEEVTFSSGPVPNMGNRLTASSEVTAKLIGIFEAAGGNDVPFRVEGKQGSFSSVAAAQTFAIMRQACPK